MDVECAGSIDLDNIESKYKLFFECALDVVFLVDINGDILDANRAAVREYGYTHEELLGMNVRDLRVPRERSLAGQQFRVAFDKGAVYETVHMRKDGSELPVEISSRGLVLNGRKVLLTIVRDITKRKEAERNLSRIAAIVESSDDAILGMTMDGIITEWNRGAEKMYEYTAKDMVGCSIEILIPEDRAGEFDYIARTIKQGGHLEHFDTVRLRKDGERIIVSLTASPIRNRNGELLGISWTARDITERKQNEEVLRRQAAIIDLSPDAIMYRKLDGTITFWSRGAESLYEWTMDEAIGKVSHSLLKTRFPKPLEKINDELAQTGYWSGTLHHATRDGGEVVVESRWLAQYDNMGNIREVLETNIDITERYRAENELENEKDRLELYYDLLGHDINNMNQVGIGFLEMALGSGETCPTKEYMEKVLETLQNSSKLIDNVHKLRALETHAIPHNPVDVCQIISKVKADYATVPGRDVTINFHSNCKLKVDANELLMDVFSNIVGNAIKHSSGPLTVDVGVQEVFEDGRRYCKVTVQDNGPGIPPDIKGKLFTRFLRGRTKAHGKGLGLYLAKTIVTDFHGKILVEDRVPGDYTQGARFIVLLPAVKK